MSQMEQIELQDMSLDDRIELTSPPQPCPERVSPLHTGSGQVQERLSRAQVVRLQGDSVMFGNPLLHDGTGAGHHFQPCSHTQLTWCDLCGDFIWGLYKQSLRCIYCRFTCHHRCRALIQLDCSSNFPDQLHFDEGTVETDTNVDELIEWRKRELSAAEVQQKVKEYNAQINSNLLMVLNRDGSYTGFIKVHFRLVRPVSVPPAQAWARTQERTRHRTSFYLPKDAAKYVHISSHTRAREVIQALLDRFTMVDDARKFALFERSLQRGKVCLRRLGNAERPLQLRLCAGPSEETLSLELQEDETGEVNWDAFTLPELDNFLRILEREEEEHVKQVVQRYAHTRDILLEALARFTPG
ncbi:ras association domain-containing protein 1-like [Megalops cyprinoides]|uniref:ras association domain-containing protein 1-like n=1 Tax=Megalops cyprinoides TaxID=118141 RepID=UPI001863BB53|nr:ras association domain-containing protein 1-like [Megalops cyprinoides]XP_036387561.1 ras association domain-containing protein 1-like [Megalops cyprinoides]XP_036387563.1 ras association domain-containing protein 1-like [Megalops cyprinoides]